MHDETDGAVRELELEPRTFFIGGAAFLIGFVAFALAVHLGAASLAARYALPAAVRLVLPTKTEPALAAPPTAVSSIDVSAPLALPSPAVMLAPTARPLGSPAPAAYPGRSGTGIPCPKGARPPARASIVRTTPARPAVRPAPIVRAPSSGPVPSSAAPAPRIVAPRPVSRVAHAAAKAPAAANAAAAASAAKKPRVVDSSLIVPLRDSVDARADALDPRAAAHGSMLVNALPASTPSAASGNPPAP